MKKKKKKIHIAEFGFSYLHSMNGCNMRMKRRTKEEKGTRPEHYLFAIQEK